MNKKMEIMGLYSVPNERDVYLLEFQILDKPSVIDVSEFMQIDQSVNESDWQVAYDEHYLNQDGTIIIGDYFNRKEIMGETTRLVFYMYLEDLSLPLRTPYGEISLPAPSDIPNRLTSILDYESAD